jgi:glycosyltransferase involved in cell wall biosynthesis
MIRASLGPWPAPMRVVFLSGIWPPDVGGPASHGPELARFLVGHGHHVHVVTMGDAEPTERPCPIESVPRSLPFPVRYPLVAARAGRAAARADVVYASATYAAAAAAAAATRRPLVVKLVSDPAYERARRWGLFGGALEEFQTAGPRWLVRARSLALGRAVAVIVPSEYLARIALGWGLDPRRVFHVPNPAPDVEAAPAEAPKEPLFVFAGRLTRQKALTVALDALERVPGARLVVVGDGPDRAQLERHAARLDGRVEFRGALPRRETLDVLAGATAAVLSSDWENLPHAAVEALALGVPVVATAVGGVPEVVRDGENGLLVPAGDVDGFAEALRRVAGDRELRDRLAAAARPSVAELSAERVYGRIEEILREAAG